MAEITMHQSTTGLTASLFVIGTIAVGLRFYGRKLQRHSLWWDDYVMIPTWLSFLGMMSCMFYGLNHRFIGYPKGTPQASSPEVYAKVVVAFDMMSVACMGMAKISALLFYQRIFCIRGQWNWFRIVLTVCIVIISLWTTAYFILPPLECGTHFEALWQNLEKKSFCRIGYLWLLTQSSTDLVLEVVILILPIPKIWALHAGTKKKLAITFVFLAGLVSLGASAARLVIFVQTQREEVSGKVEDAQLSNTKLMWMIVLEDGMTLIAVNLPSLWFLRKQKAPEKLLSSVRSVLSLHSLRRGSKDKVDGGEAVDSDGHLNFTGIVANLVPDHGVRQECQIIHESNSDGTNPPTIGMKITRRFDHEVEVV